MKNSKILFRALAALCCILLLCCACALADGVNDISGKADQTTAFYVYARQNTTLTLTQDRGTLQRSSGWKNSAYGGYEISYYTSGQAYAPTLVDFDDETVSIKLNGGTYLMVTVTPRSLEQLTQRDAFLGYPGSYTGWITPSAWRVSSANYCTVSSLPIGGAPTVPGWSYASPTAIPSTQVTINVYYRLTDGTLISSSAETLSVGTHTVRNRMNGGFFSLVSPSSYTVTVYPNGTVSQPSVTFYFERMGSSTPVPTAVPTAEPKPVTINVFYMLRDGTLLATESRPLMQGLNTLYCDYSYVPSAFTFVGPASHQVTVFNGVPSMNSVTFYFDRAAVQTAAPVRTATPAPAARSAIITIYYRMTDGTLLTSEQKTLVTGTHTITSGLAAEGLIPVGTAAYTVTVSAEGLPSTGAVTFYYERQQIPQNPPTPQAQQTVAPATVQVYYRLTDGSLLSSEQKTLTAGSHTITSNLKDSGLTLVGSATQTVTVNANGTPSTDTVTFYFERKAVATPTPTPAPAGITVYYRTTDGTLLSTEQKSLPAGTHVIASSIFPSGMALVGNTTYTVTVSAAGVPSTSSVTFYFNPIDPAAPTDDPNDTSDTDQEAVIALEKIFPRPRPGDGKNEFNYPAQGQKVTVHTKAISLKQYDDNWWVCISAELKCWGQKFTLDHEWIRWDYLDSRSYDFDKVPLDPEYGYLEK